MFWAAPMTPSAGQPEPAKPLSFSFIELAKGSSTLTPALEGGRPFSYSHRPEELLEASFVSAWDLYQERIRRALTVIGSSEDPAHCARERVCACVCACVCASLRESLPVAHSSMNVSEEDSQ